jgi:hypothetical protein
MQLLRAMDEEQAKGKEEAQVNPAEVAEQAGLDSSSLRFREAVSYLENGGAIVRDERFSGIVGSKIYLVTWHGLALSRGSA